VRERHAGVRTADRLQGELQDGLDRLLDAGLLVQLDREPCEDVSH
jgi:hypothetical protein